MCGWNRDQDPYGLTKLPLHHYSLDRTPGQSLSSFTQKHFTHTETHHFISFHSSCCFKGVFFLLFLLSSPIPAAYCNYPWLGAVVAVCWERSWKAEGFLVWAPVQTTHVSGGSCQKTFRYLWARLRTHKYLHMAMQWTVNSFTSLCPYHPPRDSGRDKAVKKMKMKWKSLICCK